MAKPFLQDVPRGNTPTRTLTLSSYQNGLDNISSQQNTTNESATNVLNMIYLEDGLIQKRFGTNPYNAKTYNSDITFFDTFHREDGADILIVATKTEVFAGDTKIHDLQGTFKGVQVNTRYFFIEERGLYSYEKVGEVYKVFKIKTPTNLEDSVATYAKKHDKELIVANGNKFRAGMYVQIGERVVDNKGMVSDVPPPQVLPILKVEGNKIFFGEKVKIDTMFSTTNTSDTNNSDSDTKSDTNESKDQTSVKQTGNDPVAGYTTTTDSKRLSGIAKTTTTVIGTGVSIVTTKEDVKEEDTEITKYYRLEYDVKEGTKIIIFQEQQKYKYIGDWKEDSTSKWYEPCTHELQDAFLGVNILPEKPTNIAFNKNRLIVSGGDTESHVLYISELNNPYYFPVSTGVTLPANGDSINGLASFHDSLVITRKDDIHCLYGSANNPDFGDPFRLKQVTTHTGCSNGNSIEVVHNFLFYLGTDGIVYRMNTTNTDIRLLTTSVLTKTVDLFKAPLSFTYDDFKTACSTFTNEYYYLSIRDKVLVYSYRFQAWTVFDRLGVIYIGKINDEVIWSKGNRLFHFDKETFLDEGIDYNCLWESKLFDLDLPVNYKYFKYISIVFDTYEQFDSTAKLVFEIDYEDVTLNHVFVNNVSRWGVAKWGVSRFASRNTSKSLPIYVGRRGRLVKIKINNGNYVSNILNTLSELDSLIPKTNSVAYVKENQKHYKYIYKSEDEGLGWLELGREEINQPIKLYNIEIEYSIRGRR